MLYFSRLKIIAILSTACLVMLFAIPNLLPAWMVDKWPQWAQRQIVLGLDLRGGSHLLLEVDAGAVRKEMAETLRDDARRTLQSDHIAFSDLTIRGGNVELRIGDSSDRDRAVAMLRRLVQVNPGPFEGRGQQSADINEFGDSGIRLAPASTAVAQRLRQAVGQSIEIVERRINQLGTVEPLIEREGSDRIVIEVPGLQDPTRLKALLGRTAKLTFQLVDLSVPPGLLPKSLLPAPGSEILYDVKHVPPAPYLVSKDVAVSGADLTDAEPGFDQRTGLPIVTFRLNAEGARRFAQVTRENVGRPFAMVLDHEIISAPVIREPIVTGSGEISGNFTVQQANDLAVLLRAGALPVPLSVIEERTIGPGLGQDSIRSGEMSAAVGATLVALFMVTTYGLFGVIANVAVCINVAMILGLLSLLDATLTLPGIAGIVLTIGIAVDSNVLIYERIREEIRHGRSPVNAIENGFERALATILDSNISTLIAACILFFVGSGPVRGFAVTLGAGIVTTLFTAFSLTRMIIAWWLWEFRPRRIPI
jgi:preprotein translocase subunit SecD